MWRMGLWRMRLWWLRVLLGHLQDAVVLHDVWHLLQLED